ncbi:hypothetical protein [Nonomuraea sp. NEAU-A123]|uniref:hypothetical protein n=1 Tax=Nonomuraea sp. NEAU-A123 TaxID=2839649 RepID=UPI001BE3FAD4|nr:hypothetical protein [Nonomuraea sp. NEAU-A123]MBT2229946.1 hypothetical protein [Nonomuraea sp. NEAU-A123]
MRHTSATAALLATAVIGGLGIIPTAAHAQAGPSEARAVWIKSCTDKKNDTTYPCGHWQLILRDGRKIAVKDAAATGVDGKGRKVEDAGLFAISGDGHVIAYERARDHRIVVRGTTGGPVKVLAASLVPKRYGTEPLALYLSPQGDRLLIDSTDDRDRVPGKVVTVATGKVVELPAKDTPQGFSGDGGEVLVQHSAGDNTSSLVAYRGDGTSVKRTPPQVVANAALTALAADGKTVAAIVSGDEDAKKAPRLRIYDLETGDLSAGVDLALKPGQTPSFVRWTGDGQLTALVQSGDDGSTAVVRVLTVDVATGAVTQTDRYSISKTRYAFGSAGE